MLSPRSVIAFVGVVIVSLALFGCTSKGPGGSSASVPEPLSPDSDQVLAYVALPGIDTVLGDVAAFGDLVEPGSMNQQMLATQLGATLGDPQLATIRRDQPIVLLVLKGSSGQAGPPPVAAFLPAENGSPIEQAVARFGMQATRSGDLLLVGESPEALAQAEKLRSVYDRISEAKIQHTGRVYLHAGRILEIYRPLLDTQIASLSQMAGMFAPPQQPGGMSIATILKAEVNGLLALLSQSDELQLSVDLGRDGASGDAVLVAKPGSALGKFFAGSAQQKARAPDYTVAEGALAGSCAIDPKGLSALAQDVITELKKDPALAAVLKPELTDLYTGIDAWWTGTAFFQYGASDGGVIYEGVMGVPDAEKFDEVWRKWLAMFKEEGALHEMYKSLGMELVGVQETSREHAGVSIRELSVEWKAGGAIPAEALSSMPSGWQIAVADGQALLSSDSTSMDRMVDNAKAGRESEHRLAAREVFGAGQQVYQDVHFLRLLQGMAGFMGPAGAMFANVAQSASESDVPPVSIAVAFADRRTGLQLRVPSALVKVIGSLGRQGHGPPPPPPAGIEPPK